MLLYSRPHVCCAAAARPKPAAYLFRDELKAALSAARQSVPYNYKDLFKVLIMLMYWRPSRRMRRPGCIISLLGILQSPFGHP